MKIIQQSTCDLVDNKGKLLICLNVLRNFIACNDNGGICGRVVVK